MTTHNPEENTPDTEERERMNRVHNQGICKCCDNLMALLSSRDTYWKERVLAILEDVLDREYQKRNPPKKHNYLESFMWDIHKAFMKDITNEDNLK